MDARGDVLASFRRRHRLRYTLLLIGSVTALSFGVIGVLLAGQLHPFLFSLSLGVIVVMAVTVFFLLHRWRRIRKYLVHATLEMAERDLAGYLDADQAQWHQAAGIRLVSGVVFLGGFFLLLLAKSESRLKFVLPSFFILLVLMSMLRQWLLFLDQVFLQDIIHISRDQASKTPE